MAEGRTIRSLLVRLGVKTDTEAVKTFNSNISAAKDLMGRAALAAAGLTAGILALAAATWTATGRAADHAEELKQTAETLGITTDELQELRHVFDQFPLGTEGALRTLNRLNLSVGNFRKGAGEASEGFKLLGLRAKDFDGLGLPEVLERVADGYTKQTDEQKRLLSVQRIFGDELAARVAPALAKGAAGIQELRRAARELNLVLDEGTIENLGRIKGQMQAVRGVMVNLGYRFGAALAPAIDVATEAFLRWYTANSDWIALRFEEASDTIAWVMRGIGRAFDEADAWVREHLGGWERVFNATAKALVAFGIPALLGAITVAAVAAATTIGPVIASLGAPFFLFAAAVGVVAAGIAGLLVVGEDLYQWLQGGDSLFGRYLEWLGINEEALAAVRGILAALTETGWAFVDLLDATLAPLGGMRGAATLLIETLQELWRRFWRFFGQNVAIRTVNNLTSGLGRLRDMLKSVAELLREMPTAAERMGAAVEVATAPLRAASDFFGGRQHEARYGRRQGMAGGLEWMANTMGSTLRRANVGDTITVGETTVNITEPNATPEEVADAVQNALASKFRLARDVAAGGDR